ncbi:hypothetical protein Mapa_002802 [Marchantia paleacea]|nr:hypothetical protein Mapa_002802 [Marchantia paleacea]
MNLFRFLLFQSLDSSHLHRVQQNGSVSSPLAHQRAEQNHACTQLLLLRNVRSAPSSRRPPFVGLVIEIFLPYPLGEQNFPQERHESVRQNLGPGFVVPVKRCQAWTLCLEKHLVLQVQVRLRAQKFPHFVVAGVVVYLESLVRLVRDESQRLVGLWKLVGFNFLSFDYLSSFGSSFGSGLVIHLLILLIWRSFCLRVFTLSLFILNLWRRLHNLDFIVTDSDENISFYKLKIGRSIVRENATTFEV